MTWLTIPLAAAIAWGSIAAPEEGFFLDVPFVYQSPRLCGPAALAMALRYWGRDVDQTTLAGAIDSPHDGATGADLERLARTHGLLARRVAGTRDGLQLLLRTGRPVIVALAPTWNGPNHFMLVVGWDRSANEWIVHDPADGPYRRVGSAAFSNRWRKLKNWALLVERGAPERPSGPPAIADPSAPTSVSPGQRSEWLVAENRLLHAIRVRPSDTRSYWELAGVYFREKRNRDARDVLRQGLRLAPFDPYAHDFLATLLYLDGRRVEALYHWNLAGAPVVREIVYRAPEGASPAMLSRLYRINEGERLTRTQWLDAAWTQAQLLPQYQVAWRLVPIREDDWSLEIDVVDRQLSSWTAGLWRNAWSAALEREISIDVPGGEDGRAAVGFRWDRSRQRLRADWQKLFVSAPADRLRIAIDVRNEAWRTPGLMAPVRLQSGEIGVSYDYFLPARRSVSAHVTYLQHAVFAPEGVPSLRRAPTGFAVAGVGWRHVVGLDKADTLRLQWSGQADAYVPLSRRERRAHRVSTSASIRWHRSDEASTTAGVAMSAGTARGGLPLDRHFVLGVGPDEPLLLRAHPTLDHGMKGGSPIGRHFALVNFDVERRFVRLGRAELRGLLFADQALVSGPERALSSSRVEGRHGFTDAGGGLRLRLAGAPVLDILIGRDLRSGVTRAWMGLSRGL